MNAETLISTLGLAPHPEGGHYRETYRHVPEGGGRGAVTAIDYLVRAGEASAWHRIDAVETWHHTAGATLALEIALAGAAPETLRLGPDVPAGERPQGFVPAGAWQSARSLGAWTLTGCVVAPAFEFTGFEMAPPGWTPDLRSPDLQSADQESADGQPGAK